MASFRHFAVRKPSEIFEMMKQNSLKKMSKRKHVRCIWLALWSSWQRHFPKIEVLPVRLTCDHIGPGIKWRMIRVTMATNSEISACRTSLGRYGYRPLTCSSQIIGRLLSSSASILDRRLFDLLKREFRSIPSLVWNISNSWLPKWQISSEKFVG